MKISIFWHRRDLRLHDNAGLYRALKNQKDVLPLFIFDRSILDDLDDKKDARVSFIHQHVNAIKEELQAVVENSSFYALIREIACSRLTRALLVCNALDSLRRL